MATLSGKLAIISGAGGGIGKAACKIFVREGAKVIAADRNFDSAKDTQQLLGGNVYAIQMDVSSNESVLTSLKEILSVFKAPPSIVVNNAGIAKDNTIFSMSEREFDDVIEVNLKGTFLMMQNFARAMVDHDVKDGSIVNISSILAKTGSHLANYSASKGGVDSMTKTASKEFAKHGIRVNAVSPGYILTPMSDQLSQKARDMLLKTIPLHRAGQPSEVGEVIAFLASQRSSYINGAVIDCTGGM